MAAPNECPRHGKLQRAADGSPLPCAHPLCDAAGYPCWQVKEGEVYDRAAYRDYAPRLGGRFVYFWRRHQ